MPEPDHRDIVQSQLLRRQQPAVPGDHAAVVRHQHRRGPAELHQRGRQLHHLRFRVRPRVPGIRHQARDRPALDLLGTEPQHRTVHRWLREDRRRRCRPARWAADGVLSYDNIPITQPGRVCQPPSVAVCHPRPAQRSGRGYFVPPVGQPPTGPAWRSRGWNPGWNRRVEPWIPGWNPVRVPAVSSQPSDLSRFLLARRGRVETGWNPGHRIRVSSQAFVKSRIFCPGRAVAGTSWTPAGFHPGFQLTCGSTNEKSHPKVALEPGTLVFHSVAGEVSDHAPQHTPRRREEPFSSSPAPRLRSIQVRRPPNLLRTIYLTRSPCQA